MQLKIILRFIKKNAIHAQIIQLYQTIRDHT